MFSLLACGAISLFAFAATSKPICVVSMNIPKYPPLARTARIQGPVILKITINEKGEVADVAIVSGHPMLSDAAITSVKTWRFETPVDGKSVEMLATYKYILDAGNAGSCSDFKFESPATVEVYSAPVMLNTSNSKTK
jgi:TonB family protein